MPIKEGAPIKMQFDGIEIELLPSDNGYARAKAQIEAKQDLMFADARAKLGDQLKNTIKAAVKDMIADYDAVKDADPNDNPRLVLAGWALGVWFDGNPKGWSDTQFVDSKHLELRERAKRSDAGQPKK